MRRKWKWNAITHPFHFTHSLASIQRGAPVIYWSYWPWTQRKEKEIQFQGHDQSNDWWMDAHPSYSWPRTTYKRKEKETLVRGQRIKDGCYAESSSHSLVGPARSDRKAGVDSCLRPNNGETVIYLFSFSFLATNYFSLISFINIWPRM